MRALGIRIADPVPGALIEVVVTQAGDWMWRIRFDIQVDHHARTECMLLPASDLWEPSTAEDRDRLRQLVRDLDIRW